MKLNLSDISKSDIKYTISHMPDGQQDIVIGSVDAGNKIKIDPRYMSAWYPVTIESRFNSWKDLELIICANQALKRLGVKEIHLYIPYLLGARSDREFQTGGNSYLVDVVAPIINLQEFASVTSMDVHSDVAQACIKRFKSVDNFELVNFAFKDIIKPLKEDNKIKIISPDAGSEKKIYKLLEKFGWENKLEVVVCSKHRSIDGKLSNTVVPLNIAGGNSDLILIDDICDGGRTFINIAKYIQDEFISIGKFKGRIYLIVTHGIFSAGYKELHKYFGGIYCTNSVKDIGEMEFDGWKMRPSYIKQLKVI